MLNAWKIFFQGQQEVKLRLSFIPFIILQFLTWIQWKYELDLSASYSHHMQEVGAKFNIWICFFYIYFYKVMFLFRKCSALISVEHDISSNTSFLPRNWVCINFCCDWRSTLTIKLKSCCFVYKVYFFCQFFADLFMYQIAYILETWINELLLVFLSWQEHFLWW